MDIRSAVLIGLTLVLELASVSRCPYGFLFTIYLENVHAEEPT